MSLVKWDPLRELNKMLKVPWDLPTSTTARNPAVDIYESDNDIVIKAELPGMEAKDIDIRLENNVLTIKGERRFSSETKEENYHRIEREYGSFSRSFSLPVSVKDDKIKAEYKDGVLKIMLPKKEEVKPRPIKIEAA